MKKLIAVLAFAVVAGVVFFALRSGLAVAQDEEQSRFVRFVERQISTPDRQIDLGPIRGALSSDVRIAYITIADREGVWLRIVEPHLVWSRLALLRGRLDIDLLEAQAIEVLRKPVPAENTTPIEPGAEEFQLPGLPVAVKLDRLSVPDVAIAEGIIGPSAKLSVGGAISLADGALDARVGIRRLDRPGDLTVITTFDNASHDLALNFTLAEPADGVVANALNIEGKPPIEFKIDGTGPISAWNANIALNAAGKPLLSGTSTISREAAGLHFVTDIEGNLESLVAPLYRPYVAGGTELKFDATNQTDGAFVVREGRLTSGVANLQFSADIAPGGVPRSLKLAGKLARGDGGMLPLPGGGVNSTLKSATIDFGLGGDVGDAFKLDVVLDELESTMLSTPRATITGGGRAANLADPATRDLTFDIEGKAEALRSTNGAVADALGQKFEIKAKGAWQGANPVTVETADIVTGTLGAHFDGTVLDKIVGNFRLNAADISAFAGIADRPLTGSVALAASGTVGFDGLFDMRVDGDVDGVTVGIPAADGLLAGRTTLAGRAARSADGVAFDEFALRNPQLAVTANGAVNATAANLTAEVNLTDLSVVNPKAAGPIAASLTVGGAPQSPSIAARITSPSLTLNGQTLAGLAVAFDGTYARQSEVPFDLDGKLDVSGSMDGAPVRIVGALASAPGSRSLTGLDADVAGATASGDLTYLDSGLLTGDLAVNVPELRRLAALALQEASGSIRADVNLTVQGSAQNVAVNGNARNVAAAGIKLGEADVDLAVDNAFGLPALAGRANLRNLQAVGYDVVSADVTADRSGDTTNLVLGADIGSGTIRAAGSFARKGDGLTASLSQFQLAQGEFAADLQRPTTVDLAGQTITLGQTAITIGDGSIVVEGTIADDLDLTATVDALPLRIANLIKPDLAVGGTVSGTVDVGGTRAAPTATADIRATGVTAAMLVERGIQPLDAVVKGSYADGTATLEEFSTAVGGGSVRASGTVGETLNLTASVDQLPLALANTVRPELELQGTITGRARVTGTQKKPAATFDIAVDEASAAPMRKAGLEALNATATGSYADGTARLETLRTTVGGGSVEASGTIGEVLDVTVTVARLPLALANVAAPDLDVSGTLSGTARATGSLSEPNGTFDVAVESATAKPLKDARLQPLNATAKGSIAGRTVTLDALRTTVGGGTISARGKIGEALDVTVDVANLPLALANAAKPDLDARGTLSGTAVATGSLTAPDARFEVFVRDASVAQTRASNIAPLNATARGSYADKTATLERFETDVGGGKIVAMGTVGDALNINVRVTDLPLGLANAAVPNFDISGTLSADAAVTGTPAAPQATFDVTVEGANAKPLRDSRVGAVNARVAGRYAGDTATLTTAHATIGTGAIDASGTVGRRLDVVANLERLPLGVANGFVPNLGIGGDLSGRITATGSLTDPRVEFDITAPAVSAAPIRDIGLPPARIDANGTFAQGTVDLRAANVRIGSGLIAAQGRVGQQIDVGVNITNIPVALANGVQPGLGLAGTLNGSGRASGTAANPNATFNLAVAGFSATPLQQAGVGALRIDVDGAFANRTVRIARATVGGSGGLSVDASGTVPLQGGGLNVAVNARAPLSLANGFLIARGATATGTVVADVRVGGSLAAPSYAGSVTSDGFGFRDPLSNLTLANGQLSAALSGNRVVLNRATASLGDGTIGLTGSVGLGAGFPADLRFTASNARYADQKLIAVTFSSQLSITGPLTGSPAITGRVDVDRTEIQVPTRLSGTAALIEVYHLNTPPDVLETLKRAEAGPYADKGDGDGGGAGLSGPVLDVTVNAPSRIFIRGRGIDAELGGQVRVTGPISDVVPVGEIKLIRGRINILTQRINLKEGTITLTGDLNPTLYLVAESSGKNVTARVVVEGQVNDPNIRFESTPELPQDEVLAQLIFGRSIEELSPFQLAQLAAAVAELAGGGSGPNVLEQVRIFSGLDDLDIVTSPGGGTSVQAGRYIADNVYLGIRAGESSGVTANLDVTENVTIRAEALTDESSIGIYFEREY